MGRFRVPPKLNPPSTRMICPVKYTSDSSLAKNKTTLAISSRLTEASQGDGILDAIAGQVTNRLAHVCFDHARRDAIDAHLASGQFFGQAAGQAVDAAFAGGGNSLRHRDPNSEATLVSLHNAPRARESIGWATASIKVIGTVEVGIDHIVPLLMTHRGKQAVANDAGRIDEDVDLFPRR